MKEFFLLAATIGLVTIFVECLEDQPLILIQHPDVATHFMNTQTRSGGEAGEDHNRFSKPRFWNLNLFQREKLCLRSVRLSHFVATWNGKMIPAHLEDMRYTIRDFHVKKFFQDGVVKSITNMEIKALTKSHNGPSEIFIKALPCIIDSDKAYFIADGRDKNLFFVFSKLPYETHVSLMGLAQPAAGIDEYLHDQTQLEEAFLNEFQSEASPRKRLCDVPSYMKFRVCSAATVAWRKWVRQNRPEELLEHDQRSDSSSASERSNESYETRTRRKQRHHELHRENSLRINEEKLAKKIQDAEDLYRIHYIKVDTDGADDTCMRDAEVSFRKIDRSRSDTVRTDLIKCYVDDREFRSPSFYVAVDRNEREKAYILQSKIDHESGERKLSLVMHIKNLPVLNGLSGGSSESEESDGDEHRAYKPMNRGTRNSGSASDEVERENYERRDESERRDSSEHRED